MTKYVIAMKSGFSFIVEVTDFGALVEQMKSNIKPGVENYFYAVGDVMFNVNDVSAIYPLFAQAEKQRVHPTGETGLNSVPCANS